MNCSYLYIQVALYVYVYLHNITAKSSQNWFYTSLHTAHKKKHYQTKKKCQTNKSGILQVPNRKPNGSGRPKNTGKSKVLLYKEAIINDCILIKAARTTIVNISYTTSVAHHNRPTIVCNKQHRESNNYTDFKLIS